MHRPRYELLTVGLFSRIPEARMHVMNELVFEVTQDTDAGFCAECLTESIFTQGDTWEQLRDNVREAVRAFYFDQTNIPSSIRLHLVRDEVLACA